MSNETIFGPQNEAERLIYAEESLLCDVQELICETLHDKGMTRAELAFNMAITPARVTRILNGEESLTLRTLARVFYALGESCAVVRVTSNEQGNPDD